MMRSPVDKEQVALDLLENIQASFALYEVISEGDKVIDLRMIWANQFYLDVVKLTLEDAVGMLFSQIAPHDISWIPFYGDVGLRKKGTQITEGYSDEAKQFIHVQAYSPAPGQVATVLHVRNKFVQSELVNARMRAERDGLVKSALNKMAVTFLSPENEAFDIVMSKGIKPIADVLGLDRIAVYRMVKDNPPAISQVYLWRSKTLPMENDMDVVPKLSSKDLWLDTLLKGDCINADVSKISGDQADFLKKVGCKAVYFVPIFVYGKFWGIITLEDYTNYRSFNDEDLELLNSTAHLCASAILRREIEQEAVINKEFKETAFGAAPIGFVVFDENFQLIECNDVVPEILGVTKEYYLNNLSKMEPEYQPDGSKSSEKRRENMKRALDGEIIKIEWMHCSPKGEPIPTELTLIRIKQGGKYIGLVYLYDLRNIRRMEQKISETEEFSRLMLDSHPLCCHLWTGDSRIIDCNEAAVSLYGFSSKQEHLERFRDVMPEYQPDGQSSYEKSRIYMKKAIDEGRCVFNWMHQMPNGMPIPSEVTLVRVKHKDSFVVISYTKDLREIKTLEEKAEEIYYDSLTKIHNRRYLDEVLKNLIKSISQAEGSLSLMMIDIDHFKLYNDTYGHSEGDKCLRIVAEIIAKTITRETDFVARYGGEEFTVVLPHTDEDGAHIIAEKLLDNVRNARIPHYRSNVADCVTISIGVATGKVNFFQTSDDYIKKADEMLYMSKLGGRDRYALAII